jgi:excisionase family DNA binding protein
MKSTAGSSADDTAKLRKSGLNYADIGRRFGISAARARRVLSGSSKKRVASRPYSEAKPMLTIAEASEMLRLHPNTIRRWADSGKLKAYRLGSRGDRRFRREDVEAILARKSITESQSGGTQDLPKDLIS